MSGWSRGWHAMALLPRIPFVWLLLAYRAVISPLYGEVCRYYPSCSAYAVDAFRVHGVVKGFVLTAGRLARCNPWSRGGVDHVPGSEAERRARVLAGDGFRSPDCDHQKVPAGAGAFSTRTDRRRQDG